MTHYWSCCICCIKSWANTYQYYGLLLSLIGDFFPLVAIYDLWGKLGGPLIHWFLTGRELAASGKCLVGNRRTCKILDTVITVLSVYTYFRRRNSVITVTSHCSGLYETIILPRVVHFEPITVPQIHVCWKNCERLPQSLVFSTLVFTINCDGCYLSPIESPC